jgi:hypothetical protein
MATDRAQANWRKSKTCQADGGCVELSAGSTVVLMRNSTDPDGPVLTFDRETFEVFLDDVRAGRFDLPDDGDR